MSSPRKVNPDPTCMPPPALSHGACSLISSSISRRVTFLQEGLDRLQLVAAPTAHEFGAAQRHGDVVRGPAGLIHDIDRRVAKLAEGEPYGDIGILPIVEQDRLEPVSAPFL